jgi:hypothetical protein
MEEKGIFVSKSNEVKDRCKEYPGDQEWINYSPSDSF